MVEEQEVFTIAEASRRLGIGEKRLRRLLTRPEYVDRTGTGTTQTRTGTRTVTLIPSPLYTDIRAALELQPVAFSMETNGDNRDKNRDMDNVDSVPVHVIEQGQQGQERGQRSPENTLVRVSVSALTALYEQRLATLQRAHGQELAAKDQVIAAKDETIEALRLALEATKEAKNRSPDVPESPIGDDSLLSDVSASQAPREGLLRGFLRRWW